jgi:uncharacterized protein YceK
VASCLSVPPLGYPAAMLSTRSQRRRETVYGWADMPEELLAKVLEAAGWQEGGLGFSQASATARLVCAGWQAVYDALVRRLVLRRETTDEAMGMLVLRFPAVASLEVKGDTWGVLTDDGLRAVSSLPALTELDLSYSNVMDQALLSLRSLRSLTSLKLEDGCETVTAAGMQALRSSTAAPSLRMGS